MAKERSKRESNISRAKRNQLWLRLFLEEGSDTFLCAARSAKAAGYAAASEHAFAVVGHQNRKRFAPQIKAWIEEHGMSDSKLKGKVISLMEAKETKFFAHEGIVVDQREVEALAIQVKATDMALKVKGLYAPEKHEIEVETVEDKLRKIYERRKEKEES